MPGSCTKKLGIMINSIWNKKVSGWAGAISNVLFIACGKVANWITTQAMLGNIKRHGKNILVMRGCVYRYPNWIELGDNVIIGKGTTMTAEICKEYDHPGGGISL